MRRFGVALGAAALLLGFCVGLAASNLDAWLTANRDAIAKRVAQALGREVSFDEVGVSLWGGLSVRVAGLAVAADPGFSEEPFLRAPELEVQVKILPALHRRIEVDRIVLRSPEIRVIRTAKGLSTASLGRRDGADAGAPATGDAQARAALLVALADIEDATLRYIDARSSPAVETVVRRLDFHASDVSPGAPVRFELEAAALGAKRRNLRATGSVDPAGGPAVDVAIELAPLDLAQALAIAAPSGQAPRGLSGSGEARVELRAKGTADDLALDARVDARDGELRVGSGFDKPRGRPLSLAVSARRRGAKLEIGEALLEIGDARFTGKGSIEDLAKPRVRMRIASKELRPASLAGGSASDLLRDLALDLELAFPSSGPVVAAKLGSASGSLRGFDYGELALEARMERERIDVSKLSLAALGGRLGVTGSVDLGSGPRFDARIDLRGASVERLLAAGDPEGPPRASGSLDARIAVRGAGAAWDEIAPTLAGGGELTVADGVLRGFNPAGEALRGLADLPILSGRKLAGLATSHPQIFGAEDTTFERFDSRIEIGGGEVVARETRLVARDYDIVAKGRYALAGHLDSSAVMAFSREASDLLVDAEKKLRFLRSRDGRVELPVVIRGTPGDLDVDADLAYVASSVSREALTDVVDRALGARRAAPDPAGAGSGEPAPPASIRDVGRDLLRRGLGGLLGGPPPEAPPPEGPPPE